MVQISFNRLFLRTYTAEGAMTHMQQIKKEVESPTKGCKSLNYEFAVSVKGRGKRRTEEKQDKKLRVKRR